jgi:hypothetical protein
MFRMLMATAMLVVAAGTASAQAPAKPDIDPIGEYTIELTFQGQAVALTAKIEKRADGTIGGYLAPQGSDALPIKSASSKENVITILTPTPDGSEATIQFTVAEDDSLSGKWWMQGDGSIVTGKRVKKG